MPRRFKHIDEQQKRRRLAILLAIIVITLAVIIGIAIGQPDIDVGPMITPPVIPTQLRGPLVSNT